MAVDAAVLAVSELLPLSSVSPRVLRSLLGRCGPHAACYGADIADFLGGDAGRFVVALGACLCLRAFPQTSQLDSPTATCEILLGAIVAVAKHHFAPAFAAACVRQLAILESDLDGVQARLRGVHPRVTAVQFAAFIGSPQPATAAAPEADRHSAVTAYLAALDTPSPVHSDDREGSAADRVTPSRNAALSVGGGDGASTTASPTPPGGSSKAARRRARRRALEQNTQRTHQQRSHLVLDESAATEGAAVFDGSITDPADSDGPHHAGRSLHPAVLLMNGSDHPPTHPGFQRGVVPQGPYSTMFHHRAADF